MTVNLLSLSDDQEVTPYANVENVNSFILSLISTTCTSSYVYTAQVKQSSGLRECTNCNVLGMNVYIVVMSKSELERYVASLSCIFAQQVP